MHKPDGAEKSFRRLAGAMLLVLVAMLCAPMAARAAAVPIDQVSTFGNGTVPWPPPNGGTMSVTQTVNGTPTALTLFESSYYTNGVNIAGNPGTVTVNVSIDEVVNSGDSSYTVNHATVTITADVNSGAVTVTGTGASMTNNPIPVSIDGTTVMAPNSGSFTASGTATVEDRTIQVCVAGNPARVCVNIFLQQTPPPSTPQDPATFINDRDEAARRNLFTAIHMFGDQMTVVMMQQIAMLGPLLDAKHQMESQLLFGEWQAETHRDYQPSEQICGFGTLTRATVNAREKVDRNVQALNAVMEQRDLLNGWTAASWGPFSDKMERMVQYKNIFCDPNDNMAELGPMCASGTSERKNNDINYFRTVGRRLTLDIDFTDGAITKDEEDIIALSRNLFNHTVLTPIPETILMPHGQFNELQDARSIAALRSIARNSFAYAVASKTPGSGLNANRLREVMAGLGVPLGDIADIIGTNPSYYAQMNILSKKLFQDPQFIANLHVSPANVARMNLTLQAIQIMHDRERFDASLRKEMLLSAILEVKLREYQRAISNNRAKITR